MEKEPNMLDEQIEATEPTECESEFAKDDEQNGEQTSEQNGVAANDGVDESTSDSSDESDGADETTSDNSCDSEEADESTSDNSCDSETADNSDANKKRKKKVKDMSPEAVRKRKITKAVVWSVVGVLLFVFVLNIIILPLTGSCARVDSVNDYTGDNKYIAFHKEGGLYLSAHRAGGSLEPEETMAAFKQCLEDADKEGYVVDILEFDLHLTKDGVLVLMHDHEIDRTSNGTGKICDMTLAELKTYNFGYNFQTEDGEYKYRAEGADLTNVRIVTLEEVLTYVETVARPDHTMQYVIEIKDDGKVGKKAMDQLYAMMTDPRFDIIDRTVFGTFNADISKYVDDCNANGTFERPVVRSAGILEVLNFYYAFLWGRDLDADDVAFSVLQIPMGFDGIFDLSTKEFIDYAHSHDIAVQYWTINDAESVVKLQQNGADCIMTDNPKMAYDALHRN